MEINILNITVIGHVDSGKSTLCGQILFKSGVIDEQEIFKLKSIAKEKKMESWYLAYLMDVSEEERNKGKTIDYNIASFNINDLKINLIDSPGHKYYIHNTIQALYITDIVILVISCKEGEFESGFEKLGQTKEHLVVSKGIGLSNVIVVLNKCDEINWNNERIEMIKDKIETYVKLINMNIIGFIELSALYGDRIENLFNLLYDCKKYIKNEYEESNKILVLEKFRDINNFLGVKILSGSVTKNSNIKLEINEIYNKNFDKIEIGY
jgi:peptide chain release factor subunit 3